jgi:Holliday junction resolvasome RuvABC endonuclease subunit
MIKVLGLDISSSTIGYAVIEFDKNSINLVSYGHIKPPASSKGSIAYRVLEASKEVRKLFKSVNPDYIAVEDYAKKFSVGKSTAKTIIILSVFNEVVSMTSLDEIKREPHRYNVLNLRSVLSKFFLKTSVSKEEVFGLMVDHFKNFIPKKNKLGNIAKESGDESDAIAVALCHSIIFQKNIE